jgi:hypothetical protein
MNEVPLIFISEVEPNRFRFRSIGKEKDAFYQQFGPLGKDESTPHISIEFISSICLGVLLDYFKNIPGTQIIPYEPPDPDAEIIADEQIIFWAKKAFEDALNKLKKGR